LKKSNINYWAKASFQLSIFRPINGTAMIFGMLEIFFFIAVGFSQRINLDFKRL